MPKKSFQTTDGREVKAVTADEMRAVDRVAVEEVGLGLLQMMENAGRILAGHVRRIRKGAGPVRIVVGSGGNGGGGLACARHLANREVAVEIVLDRPSDDLTGAAATQFRILEEMGIPVSTGIEGLATDEKQGILVDALIGYGISDPVRPPTALLIEGMNDHPNPIVSLDLPSGIDPTDGNVLGNAVVPNRTITLALPKTGLETVSGRRFLADIGIPKTVYDRLDIEYRSPFDREDWVELA